MQTQDMKRRQISKKMREHVWNSALSVAQDELTEAILAFGEEFFAFVPFERQVECCRHAPSIYFSTARS
jgi:hypothetical protein